MSGRSGETGGIPAQHCRVLASSPRPLTVLVFGPARSLQTSDLSSERRDEVLSQKATKMEDLIEEQEGAWYCTET